MIKVQRTGDMFFLSCDCGNSNAKKFGKFNKTEVKIDERGRKKTSHRLVHICNECKATATPEDVRKRLSDLHEGKKIDDSLEITVQ